MKNKNIGVIFWSGVGSVTGANFMLQTQNNNILIDCGLIQGLKESDFINREPFPYNVLDIDSLFITHSHMDHIGRIPKLVKAGFSGVIYSTKETKEMAEIMFEDALKVMDMKARESGLYNESMYDKNDVLKTMSLWQEISYGQKKEFDDFSVFPKDAGHILGSAMYEFHIKKENGGEVKILFTGDSGNSPAPLLSPTEKIEGVDYIVLDSVYGDRNHEDKEERDLKLVNIIKGAIERGGTLVIPAFSIERTQVLLYEINNMVEDRVIKSIPVYLDSPLGLKITEVYKRSKKFFNDGVRQEIKEGDDIFSFPKLNIIHSSFESRKIEDMPNPKIVIAGSGMSEGGRVVNHEISFLPDPKNTILLVGYQALGTLGRQIQDGNKEVIIKDQRIKVLAKVENISGYSSHKDSDNLVYMVSDTKDTLKKAFVVLGEPKSSLFLVQKLRDNLDIDAIYPERGQFYELD